MYVYVFTCIILMLFILHHHADIDECSMHPESCLNGRCVNMDGGWRCECNPGYILDETQAYCIGMCISLCLVS